MENETRDMVDEDFLKYCKELDNLYKKIHEIYRDDYDYNITYTTNTKQEEDNLLTTEEKPIENNSAMLIEEECRFISNLLLEKNRKYGDSALHPVRIFSKASTEEQLNVRLDDKLSRIISGQADEDEDPELDIIGYLILKRVLRKKENSK